MEPLARVGEERIAELGDSRVELIPVSATGRVLDDDRNECRRVQGPGELVAEVEGVLPWGESL